MAAVSNDKEITNIELQGFSGDSKEASFEILRNVNIKEQLDKCEHYFIFWLGDTKLEKDHLPAITNELYDRLGRIIDDSDDESSETEEKSTENRKPKTKNKNSKKNTNSEVGRDSQDHKSSDRDDSNKAVKNQEVDNASENSSDETKPGKLSDNKSESESADSEDSDDESEGVSPKDVQRAVAAIIESFLNIYVGDINAAKKQILLGTKFVKICVEKDISFEAYVPGLNFLKLLLKIHMGLQEENDVNETNLESISREYDSLPDKGKAVIHAARWKFLELVDYRYRTNREKSLEALEKVASLDDSNYIWNYVLCMRLRFRRRELHGNRSKPDEKEINASVASVEISKEIGEHYHAMARAGLCQTISEVLRWRKLKKKPADQPITVGNLTFQSHDEIIKYLKKEARNALARFPKIRFAEYMRYSEIFSTGLPLEHRDYEIAIQCMTFCLQLLPTNSKAHHKMGILHLNRDKHVNEAIPFFRDAVKFEPQNYPALMDLIQSLLQRVDKNNEELEKIFTDIIEMPCWNEKQTSSLNFLLGCYLSSKGDTANAIEVWMSNPQQQHGFHELPRIKARYFWRKKSLLLEEAQKAVQEMLQSVNSIDKDLSTLYTEIKAAIDVENSRGGFNSRSGNSHGRYYSPRGGSNNYNGRYDATQTRRGN